MEKPTVRSPSSCSSASTSSMSASESASRSSANLDSRVMRSSSISRISARRSRMIASTSSGPIGLRSTCVSAGIRHCLLDLSDDVGVNGLERALDRVANGQRARRPMRDHADPLHAEEQRATYVVGIDLPGGFEEQRQDDLARRTGLGGGFEHAGYETHHRL